MTDDMRNEIADALVERRVLVAEERSTGIWYQLSLGRLVQVVRRIAGPVGIRPPVATEDITREPRPSDYRMAAVDAMGRGDLAEAARLASDAVDLLQASREPWKRADTLALLGAVANAEGDLPRSREHYLAAVQEFSALDDTRSVVRLNVVLAQMHFLSQDYSNAAIFSRRALLDASHDQSALLALGYSLWYGGSPSDALAEFNRIIGTDARASSALAARGQIRAELDVNTGTPRNDVAILADIDNALKLGLTSIVDEADTRSARALVLASRDQFKSADAELATASSLTPDRSLIWLRSALVQERWGNLGRARSFLTQAEHTLPLLSPWHAQVAKNLNARLRE